MSVSASEIERLIALMPSVASAAHNTWAVGFARSIMRQSKKPGWHPSEKQVAVMSRMAAELFVYRNIEGEDGDLLVIET